MIDRFNIRVYGICIQDGCLLVTDEERGGVLMNKLPGGGLEFGEGIEDCLIREFMEEMDVDIVVGEILYVNPFLHTSSFRAEDQLICMYFRVTPVSRFRGGGFTDTLNGFPDGEREGAQVFRWVPLESLEPEMFTFRNDRAMVTALKVRGIL